MNRRTVRLSRVRIANEGRAYTDQFTGRRVAFRTHDGTEMIGTLDFTVGGHDLARHLGYGVPVAQFPGGKWARLDAERITFAE